MRLYKKSGIQNSLRTCLPPETKGLIMNEKSTAQLLKEIAGLKKQNADLKESVAKLQKSNSALLQSDENYKRLVNHSLTGIYITHDHILKYCNQQMAEMFGYDSPDELLGIHIKNLVASDSWGLVDQEVKLRISGKKETSRYEFKCVKKDGTNFYAEVLGSRISFEEKPAVQGTIIDITERKKTEEALQESEELYRQLFDFLPYGAEILDSEGFIIDCNPGSTRLLGYTREELVGKHITEFLHPDAVHIFKNKFPQLLKGNLISSEVMMVRKDGKTLHTLHAGQPIIDNENGQIIGVLALSVDITDGKKAEREKTRLATVVEQAGEAIVITDTEGTIQYVNPAFEQVTGYTAKEALGKNPRILKSGSQDDTFYKEMWATITQGHKWQGVFANKRKDDSIFYEEAAIFPIRNETGTIVNYAAIKHDITQERDLEQQLEQMQKMEALGTLSGGVAHDFNNLLTIINGHAEMALLHTPKTIRTHSDLLAIMNAGNRAENLISQLLAFSRKQLHEPKVIGINKIITDLEKMLRRLIPEDIKIETLYKPDLPYIKADHGQIEQILINLAVNARDAIKEKNESNGQKQITIKTEFVDLDEMFVDSHPGSQTGSHVIISVSDSGIGMNENIKNRIFEPFFTTKEVDKGTGLGLATVYGIVKQNGGFIQVDSETGKGTTCKIFWPTTEDLPDKEQTLAMNQEALFGEETILLVEDDKGVRDFTAETLKSFGYNIIEALNGRNAIELIEETKSQFDLLITDIIMPEMNGQELAEHLKSTIPLQRVLFVSGYTFDQLGEDSTLEAGINFLQKPYSIFELLNKIRNILTTAD
jgi:two-component system cell cycle sensor histidine kinase/response regulator CckA